MAKKKKSYILNVRQLARLAGLNHARLNNMLKDEEFNSELTEDDYTNLSNIIYNELKPIFVRLGFVMPKPKRFR